MEDLIIICLSDDVSIYTCSVVYVADDGESTYSVVYVADTISWDSHCHDPCSKIVPITRAMKLHSHLSNLKHIHNF